MIYSVIGWLWETPYVSLNNKKYINRGFLRGMYIPIYGFACITIIYSMEIFNTFDNNNYFTIIVQIIYIGLVSAVWEYFTSYGLEKLFKTRWWDYSDHKFNLHGRVALDYTILFGAGGYILWRYINPTFNSLYNNINPNYMIIVLVCFYTIFLIDNIYTFKELFRLRNIILKLNTLKLMYSGKYDYIFEKIYNSVFESDEGFIKSIELYKKYLSKELKKIRISSGNKLANSIENKTIQLNSILSKSKNLSRFFNKYPKAKLKNHSNLLRILRYQREIDK